MRVCASFIITTCKSNLATEVDDASVWVEKWQKNATAGVQFLQGQRLREVVLCGEEEEEEEELDVLQSQDNSRHQKGCSSRLEHVSQGLIQWSPMWDIAEKCSLLHDGSCKTGVW